MKDPAECSQLKKLLPLSLCFSEVSNPLLVVAEVAPSKTAIAA